MTYGLIALAAVLILACTCSDLVPPATQPPAGETATQPPAGETATQPPAPTHPATPTQEPAPCLPDATFVQDVTVPDGTRFIPGESFVKVWRVRSDGCAPWPPGIRWTFVSGDRMGAPESVPVPETALGSATDIAVQMQAPNTPGTYRGFWQMQTPGGVPFGDRVYVTIVVSAPTPSPTPAGPSISFVADRYTIYSGECVVISWAVEHANAVRYEGQLVTSAESRLECPTASTAYELAVQDFYGQWETRQLIITVQPTY